MARAPPAARDAAMPPKKSKKEQLAAGRQKLEAFKRQKAEAVNKSKPRESHEI